MAGEAPEGNHEPDALFVAVTALLLGVLTQSVLRWTKVPYSVLLLVSVYPDHFNVWDNWKFLRVYLYQPMAFSCGDSQSELGTKRT